MLLHRDHQNQLAAHRMSSLLCSANEARMILLWWRNAAKLRVSSASLRQYRVMIGCQFRSIAATLELNSFSKFVMALLDVGGLIRMAESLRRKLTAKVAETSQFAT